MPAPSSPRPQKKPLIEQWWLLPVLLVVFLGFLFSASFDSHQVLFSSDGPLGMASAAENRLPDRFTGTWRCLAWLGEEGPAAALTISNVLLSFCSALAALKFYAPFSLFFLGFSAWLFFRQLRFNPAVCLLGGIAAALNTHFVSIACWGQGTWEVAAGTTFLAGAAIVTPSIASRWPRAILAGLAIGMGVMEGFDVGVILSLFAGAFVLFHELTSEGTPAKKIVGAVMTQVVVVIFALGIAAYSVSTLVSTQVSGIHEMKQDETTKEERWLPATRWSLPKLETLQVFVPGVFGYRMSQYIGELDRSSAYWGSIGEDPAMLLLESSDPALRLKATKQVNAPPNLERDIQSEDPQVRSAAVETLVAKASILRRFSGNSEYGGILVALLAIFGFANACRPGDTILSQTEKRLALFWGGAALFALVASWGRFAFLYRFLYSLPGISTIRNPIKFMHPFHVAWIILSVYGMEILARQIKQGAKRSQGLSTHLKLWFKRAVVFEKRWVIGVAVLIAVSLAGFLMLAASKSSLSHYLEKNGFSAERAIQMADFSCGQAAFFLAFLVASAFALTAILSRAWTGADAKWGWIILAVILVSDLLRVDTRWVHYLDYTEKYSSNAVTDLLTEEPYQHRVIGKMEPLGPGSSLSPGIGQLYYYWIQNDFPLHDIQSLDFAQMPRVPDLDRAYFDALQLKGNDPATMDLFPAVRLWQLTNTRYILCPTPMLGMLNDRGDRQNHSLHAISLLQVTKKPEAEGVVEYGDMTVVPMQNGPFALLEYPHALPRAKLYSHWRSESDDETLKALRSEEFDPETTVLVSNETPLPASTEGARDAGTVTITDYQPKTIKLSVDAKAAAVLLLNDRIAPGWSVVVDGQKSALLRCNYIMRGVLLTPGQHNVEFRFRVSLKPLYISIGTILVGLALVGFIVLKLRQLPKEDIENSEAPLSSPARAPKIQSAK